MRKTPNVIAGLAVSLASISLAVALAPQKPRHHTPTAAPKVKPVTFASIDPILKNCRMCHTGPVGKHGLDLTSYATLMKGDKEGKVVIPGKPAGSRLSKAVHRKGAAAMPPAGPLPAADVAKIDAWIAGGAKK